MSPDTIPAYQPAQDLLAERVILVTGAANGIGRATARAYARHGASVVLLDKTEKALTTVYDEIADAGLPEPALYALDLASASALDYERLAGQLAAEFGRLDGLLSNAGWVGGLSPLRSHELKRWTQAITVNLHAPFLLCHALLPLLDQGTDSAILFSTDHCARAFWGGYGVAKAGLNGLLATLADELENTRIRANGIDTGPARTQMRTENYPGTSPDDWPIPETFENAYLYLMGPDSRGINGQNWRLGDDA